MNHKPMAIAILQAFGGILVRRCEAASWSVIDWWKTPIDERLKSAHRRLVVHPPVRRCRICSVALDQPDAQETMDCGGDCLKCMAAAGDPACADHMRQLDEAKARAAIPEGTSAA